MARMLKSNTPKIEPTHFDLAIIEIVEFLYDKAPDMPHLSGNIPDKKDIQKSVGINPAYWPQMVNHQRHVSVKSAKQSEIVQSLKSKYWVNPDYVWNYPHEKEMFIVSGILKAADAGETYGYQLPGSAKLLRKDLISCKQENTKLTSVIKSKDQSIKKLEEDNENLRLLIQQLKSAKKSDKSK